MSISKVNYCWDFFPNQYLIIILGIVTYDTFRLMILKLKTNAISVHSNLGGSTHIHLGFLMMNTKYTTLPNFRYVRPLHPGILLISNNATHVASNELKLIYD